MDLWIIALGILFTIVAVAITLGLYYILSGDYLWSKRGKSNNRNWTPPR